MNQKPQTILYIEDDADDRDLLTESMQKAAPGVTVVLVPDGLQAFSYLDRNVSQLPSLIILDLNLPLIDGSEVYDRLQADARFRDIPVVLFTSSEQPQDREQFERRGAPFISKPFNYAYMKDIVREMLSYCP